MKNLYPRLSEGMGLEWQYPYYRVRIGHFVARIEYNHWEFFGYVWEWATQQEWWGRFLGAELGGSSLTVPLFEELIHPERFPQAIEEYLEERG